MGEMHDAPLGSKCECKRLEQHQIPTVWANGTCSQRCILQHPQRLLRRRLFLIPASCLLLILLSRNLVPLHPIHECVSFSCSLWVRAHTARTSSIALLPRQRSRCIPFSLTLILQTFLFKVPASPPLPPVRIPALPLLPLPYNPHAGVPLPRALPFRAIISMGASPLRSFGPFHVQCDLRSLLWPS